MSIRRRLFLLFGIPTLIAAVALALLTKTSLRQWEEARRFNTSLRLSGDLMKVLRLQAEERGWTNIYLQRRQPPLQHELDQLTGLRQRGDHELDRCLRDFRILQLDEQAIARVIRARSLRNRERTRVDQSWNARTVVAPELFFRAQSQLIESELNLDALVASEASKTGEVAFLQNRIRNRLKLVIEFAARERGTLAGFLATHRPPDPTSLNQLKGWRQLVEVHAQELWELRRNFELPTAIVESLEAARKDFEGPWEELRQKAYRQPFHPHGGVPDLPAEAFFQDYSRHLDRMNEVSIACQLEAEALSAEIQRKCSLQQFGLVALYLMLVLVSMSLRRLAQGIARPLLQLRDASQSLVRGERLALEAESSHPSDELGQLRIAFQQMAIEIGQQRERLREDRQRLSAIIENSPDFVSWADLHSVVQYLNPAGRKLLGIDLDEDIRSYRIADFGPPESFAFLQDEAMPQARAQGSWRGEIELMNRQGQRIPCELVIIVHRDEVSKVAYLSAIARDLSERRRNQLATEQALRQAEQASRAKSDFLARMSHEFRTPLNAILGFNDMLEAENYGALHPRQKKAVTNVGRASRHLLGLVNDILDLAKIEAGHDQLQPARVDLHGLLQKTLELVSPLAQAREQELRVSSPESLNLWVDETRLQQVLLNLVANAVKFCPTGALIELSWQRLPEGLEIQVRDNGPGIALEDQERIFLDFEQAQSGLDRHQEGTGLGLSLCRRLVALMGGQIGVRSQPGSGSQFWFLLPLSSIQE